MKFWGRGGRASGVDDSIFIHNGDKTIRNTPNTKILEESRYMSQVASFLGEICNHMKLGL